MAVSKKSEYLNHRARVKEKFIKNGFDGFLDYEILEMLLFYCIPRVDTKPIARRLIKKYKTLSNVLEASHEGLTSVDGIGDNAALFLTMMPKLFNAYEMSKWTRNVCLDNVDTMGQYASSLFKGKTKEEFGIICLDANRCVRWSGILLKGTVDELEAYPREVLEVVTREKATKVIFAHNHPNGTLAPSVADKEATKVLVGLLKGIGTEVLDHIIVCGNRYFSMKEMGFKF